jgi:hypothetical protein
MKKSFTAKSKILLTIILTLIMAFSVVTSVACKKKNTTTATDKKPQISENL